MKKYRKIIMYAFFITWAASVAILLYKLAYKPVTINVDLSFILEMLPMPNRAGTGDNFI